MGRVEENKKKKKEALFRTAYELFTTKGINSTAISDIVEKAGVAKGTFYLYFKDKYDIKNKLIAHKTKELFDHAAVALENSGITGLEDQLVFIIDDIINILVNNKPLLNFISKNLVMGALKSAFWSDEEADKIFYERYLELVAADTYNYKDIQLAADVGRHRAYRSAGGDDKLDAFRKEKIRVLPRIAANDIPPAVAVGNTAGVAEIYNVFLRQKLSDLSRNGKPAQSRVKNADGH